MDIATNIALGVCLSAACGFRVFAPLLVLSVAGITGHFSPDDSLAWIATWPALTLFASATAVEIVGYYVPWADNALDVIATPAALAAGAVATASVLVDLPPSTQWLLAAVLGGGTAGIVQTGTVFLRGTSSVTTGGLGNFAVATLENILALVTSILALIIPLVIVIVVFLLMVFALRFISRKRKRGVREVALE
jgi:hypothetical protein